MSLIIIAHNIRSTHNVGSILRTADGFGVESVIFCGYTPYPTQSDDQRPPHIRAKLTDQIHKTALGAETTVDTMYIEDPTVAIAKLRTKGYSIAALEQDARSIALPDYHPPHKLALLLGEEVHGITDVLRAQADVLLEIPMVGHKESFNVSVATGIALYALTAQRQT